MNYSWKFPLTQAYVKRGRGTVIDNFNQEDKTGLEILVREALQNSLDAALPTTKTIQVEVKVLQKEEFDNQYLKNILTPEYLSRLKSTGSGSNIDMLNPSVLVIEDFGTIGLIGDYLDNDADGPKENWNAFWHTEGEGSKGSIKGSNGGAGQGKITYIQIGSARCVFGLTLRSSDNKTLLMGRSEFIGTYRYESDKYLKDSYWGVHSSNAPHPITDEGSLKEFIKAFDLKRNGEPGLSLVIPLPFELKIDEIKKTIISEYYFSIASGRLSVRIGSALIEEKNIDQIADDIFTDQDARDRKSSFTKAFRKLVRTAIELTKKNSPSAELIVGWNKDQTLKETSIKNGNIDDLRELVDKEEIVHIRCPIQITPRNDKPVDSYFDVFIQVPEDLEKVEEAYIRKDLLIGSEAHLTKSSYLQKARALTLVSDPALSSFLVDAEEATHLKWNSKREKVRDAYRDAATTLSAIRQAAPRILSLLTNSGGKLDMKALAKYFTKPSDDSKKKGPGKPTPRSPDIKPPVIIVPESSKKPFTLSTTPDSVRILPNKKFSDNKSDYLSSCTIEIAYEGLDQNPYKNYDPFDFDLGDGKAHQFLAKNVSIKERKNNKVHFEVIDPDFFLEIQGFDPNLRFLARLNYEQKS